VEKKKKGERVKAHFGSHEDPSAKKGSTGTRKDTPGILEIMRGP